MVFNGNAKYYLRDFILRNVLIRFCHMVQLLNANFAIMSINTQGWFSKHTARFLILRSTYSCTHSRGVCMAAPGETGEVKE